MIDRNSWFTALIHLLCPFCCSSLPIYNTSFFLLFVQSYSDYRGFWKGNKRCIFSCWWFPFFIYRCGLQNYTLMSMVRYLVSMRAKEVLACDKLHRRYKGYSNCSLTPICDFFLVVLIALWRYVHFGIWRHNCWGISRVFEFDKTCLFHCTLFSLVYRENNVQWNNVQHQFFSCHKHVLFCNGEHRSLKFGWLNHSNH